MCLSQGSAREQLSTMALHFSGSIAQVSTFSAMIIIIMIITIIIIIMLVVLFVRVCMFVLCYFGLQFVQLLCSF